MKGAEFDTASEFVKRMILTIPDLRLKSGRGLWLSETKRTCLWWPTMKSKIFAAMPTFE
jgi:hypothetical protein